MTNKDTCEIYCYDEEKVNRIQGNLQTVDISSVAQMLKAIADKNRAKIKGIYHQETSLTRNAKGTYRSWKEKTTNRNKKIIQKKRP